MASLVASKAITCTFPPRPAALTAFPAPWALRGRGACVVQVIILANQLHILEFSNAILEAFAALLGGADAGIRVLDINLAFVPDDLSQRTSSDLAAFHVV
jgi:hypothetical protein